MKSHYRKRAKVRRSQQVAQNPAKGRSLAAWGWCLVGIVLALGLWTSPFTQPKRIKVQGVPPEGQGEVERAILQVWKSPFALRTGYGQIEKALQSIAWIESVQIVGDWMGSLVVHIRVRQPFARLETPHRTCWLDQQGVTFTLPDTQQSPDLKFSTLQKDFMGIEGALRLIKTDYDVMMTLGHPIKNRILLDALWVLVQLDRIGIRGKVVLTIDRSPNMWLNILSPATGQAGVIRVRLGNSEALPEKVRLLQRLYQADPRLLAQSEYLDLCCPTAPALKPAAVETNSRGEIR